MKVINKTIGQGIKKNSMGIIKKHCYKILTKKVSKLDKRWFAFTFNILQRMLEQSVRVEWCGDHFIVMDTELPGVRHRFRDQRHGTWAYKQGLTARINYFKELYFLYQIDFKDGDIFIDCGANVGDSTLYFRANNINIEYIGFEPSPIEFECLKHNVAFLGKAFNIGLWKDEGFLLFYVSSKNADSSFIEPVQYDDTIKIPTKKLEEFITKPVKCLKLEAEGGEPEVIEGIGDKLNLIEYIAADLGHERGVYCEATLAPVTNFLLSRGFVMQTCIGNRLCVLFRNTNFSKTN